MHAPMHERRCLEPGPSRCYYSRDAGLNSGYPGPAGRLIANDDRETASTDLVTGGNSTR